MGERLAIDDEAPAADASASGLRFTPRLRSIVTAIDPGALIQNPAALSDVPNVERRIFLWSTYLIALLAGIAVVLSAACLYALMSFTVARRRSRCTRCWAWPRRIWATNPKLRARLRR